ncbi:MAG: hypothetical protein OER86_03450, partial [Phycisphaerae bacterium]|nr:hypothetical protein [Phycisphaerae bacterium]
MRYPYHQNMALTARVVVALALFAGVSTAGSGCAPPVSEGGFNAPDPASKLYAIIRAGRERDRSAVPHLIEQL